MRRRYRALIVHSHPEARGELVDVLSRPELAVDCARSETEAMRRMATQTYSVIVSANYPPSLSGVSVLQRSVTFLPDAVRILLVQSASEAEALDRLPDRDHPIIRFVGKASERSRLSAIVAESLKLLMLVDEQREITAKLGIEFQKLRRREKLLDTVVSERTQELEISYEKLKAANRQALFGLAEAIEAKDPYTKGHCGRVAAFSLLLAEEIGYSADALENLEFGAFLHDIGKMGIRDSVLLKPGPLDEDEWEHMRSHPMKGYEIATKIEMLKPTIAAVRSHHERWDGKGYPDGLVSEDIPLVARIVAIADAYDAMATDRPYKKALALDDCERLLLKNASKMFDPELVDTFCRRHLGALYQDEYAELEDEWDEFEGEPDGDTEAELASTGSGAAARALEPQEDDEDVVIPGLDL